MKRTKRYVKMFAVLIAVLSIGSFLVNGNGDTVVSVNALSEVSYIDENGAVQTVNDYNIVSSQTVWNRGVYIASGETVISSTVTVNGNVVLILEDNCDLTVIGGIKVVSGSRLKIYAQSTGTAMGKLTADASDTALQAGIGSGTNGTDTGTIIICGGNITAKGGNNAAGIGGSANSTGGNITIYGGTITAVPGRYGAAIGGGYNGSGGRITINGGRINADSRYTSKGEDNIDSAGIGGGFAGSSGHIVINGGYITAKAAPSGLMFVKADDIGNSAAANFWGIISHITINGGHINEYDVYYTVIIPEEITIGDELVVRAENVNIPVNKKLDVSFRPESENGSFEMYSPSGDSLGYIIKNSSGKVFFSGEIVLSVSGGNTEGSSILYTDLEDEPHYSGVYTGRLTFSVSIQ